jgi:hypothetical protein
MKRTIFSVVILALTVASLQAQTLSGAWQGTLATPGNGLRTIVKISKVDAEDAALEAGKP